MVRAILVSAVVVFVGGSLGCQALYGGKPEKLRNPERKKKPADEAEAVVQVKYVDDCVFNDRADPVSVKADDARKSKQLVEEGEITLAQLPKTKEPAQQASLITRSIEIYRSALLKDPYNADATYSLAVAYDMVYRKGCALALLKRIQKLEANPRFKTSARRVADVVADNPQVFKGYRNDAKQAVGR